MSASDAPVDVSVVVPTFNRAHLLGASLESLLAEEGVELEVIVVDDGSTDDTAAFLATYPDARVRAVMAPHAGIAVARNRGLQAARGPFIAFHDSDDRALPGRLAVPVAHLRAHPDLGFVIQNGRMEGATPKPWIAADVAARLAAGPIGVAEVFRWNLGQLQGMCFTRRALDAAGRFDRSFTILDDLDLVLRVAVHFPGAFLDRVAFAYRVGEGVARDRLTIREESIRLGDKLVREHPAVLPLLGGAAFRRRQARRWGRLASMRLAAGDAAGARAALAEAIALRPAHLGYRLRALWLALGARLMRVALMHRRLAGGGTEGDLRRMSAGLAARGHAVTVFCARADAPPPGVSVRRVPTVPAGRVARLVSFAVMAPKMVARERWDVVVGFGRTARQDVVRVGGGTHRTYLARMRAAGLRRRGTGPYHRAILWLEARQFAPAGHRRVLAVSGRVRDEVVADYGVAPAHIAVIYNGVDLERFRPDGRATRGAAVRRALGVGEARVCLAIGTGFRRKGFDLLLRLWRERPPADTALVLVGDDERLAAWRRAASAPPLAERVVVTGPRADVEELLAAADVVCVPSRQEAFGNVVLEACAAGVPVVTSRRAGAAELLDGPLACLVVDDPEDLAALGAALARAVGPERSALGEAARRLAERLPWEAHLDRVETFLCEAAETADGC